jgi:hypothetical protein
MVKVVKMCGLADNAMPIARQFYCPRLADIKSNYLNLGLMNKQIIMLRPSNYNIITPIT